MVTFRSGITSAVLKISPTASPRRKWETAAWMHPQCLPAACHVQPEPMVASDSQGAQVCRHTAQRTLPSREPEAAAGTCGASGERGLLCQFQPSQMQRQSMGLLKLCLGLHSNSPLCPLGLSVLDSQLSTCSFSKRDDICCCVMHIVTSLLSIHTKGYCEKISI